MTGITDEEQQALYRDVLRTGSDDDLARIRAQCEAYERRGARFVYGPHGNHPAHRPASSDREDV